MSTHKPQSILSLSFLVIIICTSLQAQDWKKLEEIYAQYPASLDAFGASVSITGPDDQEMFAIVGDPYDDEDPFGANPVSEAGSALILRKFTWDDQLLIYKKIGPSLNRAFQAHFGRSVSISGDYSIVGADNGCAYIFSSFSGAYEHIALAARDTATGGSLGSAVSMSGDYAAVGGWTRCGVYLPQEYPGL